MAEQHINNILAAVDGSFHSSIAARYCYHIADVLNAKLFIVSVLTKKMTEKDKKDAAVSVENILNETRNKRIEAEGILLTGEVISAIRKFVIDHKIDTVFASTRAPHREKRFFARSVTSGLMSSLPCPVIGLKIAHPGRSIRPKKILIPVVGGDYRVRERADIAEAISRSFDSRLVVFHVLELNDLKIKRLEYSLKERLATSAEKRISPFVNELKKRNIRVSEKIVIGRSARSEIISEASQHKYDLIIVGTTMRNIMKRIVSGNPVEEILRDTPCDVMLVHY